MSNNYRVVYINKLQNDAVIEDVINQLSVLFKISPEKSKSLLKQEKPVIIKNNLSRDSAKQYHSKLSSIGLQVVIKASLDINKKSEKNHAIGVANKENQSTPSVIKNTPEKPDTDNLKNEDRSVKSGKLHNKIKLNKFTRISISVLIACFLTSYIYLISEYRDDKLVLFFTIFCISLYSLTGMFTIYSKKAKVFSFLMLGTGIAHPIIRKIHLGTPIPEMLFTIIATAGVLAIIIRVVAHLILPPKIIQENPELFDEIKLILDNHWMVKFESQVSNSVVKTSNIIPHIYLLLKKKASVDKITVYLGETMKNTMGVEPDIDLNKKIAIYIADTYQEYI